MTNTLDRQTLAFFGKLGTCLPPLSENEMQYWMEHPVELQGVLMRALKRSLFNNQVTVRGMMGINDYLIEGNLFTLPDGWNIKDHIRLESRDATWVIKTAVVHAKPRFGVAKKIIKQCGLRPASIRELLEYAIQHRDMFVSGPLMALGEKVGGYGGPTRVVYISVDEGDRLHLNHMDSYGDFGNNMRFLAVEED